MTKIVPGSYVKSIFDIVALIGNHKSPHNHRLPISVFIKQFEAAIASMVKKLDDIDNETIKLIDQIKEDSSVTSEEKQIRITEIHKQRDTLHSKLLQEENIEMPQLSYRYIKNINEISNIQFCLLKEYVLSDLDDTAD